MITLIITNTDYTDNSTLRDDCTDEKAGITPITAEYGIRIEGLKAGFTG